jgi:hypothetical protein
MPHLFSSRNFEKETQCQAGTVRQVTAQTAAAAVGSEVSGVGWWATVAARSDYTVQAWRVQPLTTEEPSPSSPPPSAQAASVLGGADAVLPVWSLAAERRIGCAVADMVLADCGCVQVAPPYTPVGLTLCYCRQLLVAVSSTGAVHAARLDEHTHWSVAESDADGSLKQNTWHIASGMHPETFLVGGSMAVSIFDRRSGRMRSAGRFPEAAGCTVALSTQPSSYVIGRCCEVCPCTCVCLQCLPRLMRTADVQARVELYDQRYMVTPLVAWQHYQEGVGVPDVICFCDGDDAVTDGRCCVPAAAHSVELATFHALIFG